MTKIYFIGEHDKSDLLFYLAKVLSVESHVLLVDATQKQLYRYSFPRLDVKSAIVTYDGFDVLTHSEQGLEDVNFSDYDHIIYDIDDEKNLPYYSPSHHYVFVSGMDQPSILRGEQLVSRFFQELPSSELVPFYKVLYEAAKLPGESYINEKLEPFPIDWKGTITYYPDERDLARKIRNQYSSKIDMRKLSAEMKEAVKQLIQIVENTSAQGANGFYKQAERRK